MTCLRLGLVGAVVACVMLAFATPAHAVSDSEDVDLGNGCSITAERYRNSQQIGAFTVEDRGCSRLLVVIVYETCSGIRRTESSGWQRGDVWVHIPLRAKVIRTTHGGESGGVKATFLWPWGWDGC